MHVHVELYIHCGSELVFVCVCVDEPPSDRMERRERKGGESEREGERESMKDTK